MCELRSIFNQIKSKFPEGNVVGRNFAGYEAFKISHNIGLIFNCKLGNIEYYGSEKAIMYDGPKRYNLEDVHELCAELEICCDETLTL